MEDDENRAIENIITWDLIASDFRMRFRLSSFMVEEVLRDVGPRLRNQRQCGLQPHHRMLLALRYYATDIISAFFRERQEGLSRRNRIVSTFVL